MKPKTILLSASIAFLFTFGFALTSASQAAAAPVQSELAVLSTEISDEEINGLLFMREEEKLAHDVYVVLYETWGLNLFSNIAASEQTHTDAVQNLLDAYGVPDPTEGLGFGEFANADLQALYNQLIEQGSLSLADALRVGAAIEEIDILDLQAELALTDNASIRLVYENLLKGSRNHLRSFTSTLSRTTGETYAPQYLSPESYAEIVSTSLETGGRGNGQQGIGQQSSGRQGAGRQGGGRGR